LCIFAWDFHKFMRKLNNNLIMDIIGRTEIRGGAGAVLEDPLAPVLIGWLSAAAPLATSSRGEAPRCRRRIASILGGLALPLAPAVVVAFVVVVDVAHEAAAFGK
jgi:hypothetical protein